MKQLTFAILAVITLLFTTCKKDNGGPSTTLPEATQEGKNTFGMKVNGEVWTPYYKCGPSANPCGALSVTYYDQPGILQFYFTLTTAKKTDNSFTTFEVNTMPRYTTISSIGNKYDSLNVAYTDYGSNRNGRSTDYTKSYTPKGNFTITKLDFANQIIAGTFTCTLYNGNDSIVITDGRFDSKFYTCICN
ncbi:MAG: hypothetical protein QM541_01690 [Flavobacterium sp.]|nr:hypothetical protein [Flavobacterium sp.]